MNSFLLTNGLPCMILAEAPRPNRPKKDESVLHMMSFSCILLRAFDAFEPPGWPFLLHRVGHWWCAICFWCSFSPGNSYWAEDLVWRWNAPGPSPYDSVERHRQPSLLCETGPPACHGTWGLTIGWRIMYPIYSTYKRGCGKSCGALGGGALIACFPVHGIGCPLWSLPGSRWRREGNNSYMG